MLYILGMIILIIISFIIILLAVGLKIRFEYNKKGSEFKGCLKILILKKIKIYSHKFPSDDKDEDDDSEDKERKQRDVKKILKLAKPCFRDILNYLKTILSKLKVAKAKNHIIFGVESYADTAKYMGMIWAAAGILNSSNEKVEISAEPSFNGLTIDGEGVNEVEIPLLKMITPTIRLVSKKEVRTLIRGVWDER